MNIKNVFATLFLSACLSVSSASFAEGPHAKQIETRQAIFKLYSYHFGILTAMAKGKMDYDAELAVEAANNLAAATQLGQTTLWPAGSDNSNPENTKTRALPAIWETYPDIIDKGADLQEAATALAAEAGNGLDALKANLGAAGDACKSCHQDFRARKK